MQKIINISSFSRSRLNQDPVKGSFYGWHSQFARHISGHCKAVVESWSIDAALSKQQAYEREGVTYRLFPSGFFLSPGREISTALLKALRQEARDHEIIVHLHDYHNWQSYAIALTIKAPVVAHYHGATRRPIENLRFPRRWLFAPLFLIEQLFENRAVRRIRHFFLANTRSKDYFERRSLPYSFCPMAPELDVFSVMDKGEARQVVGERENKKIVLHVGGFAPVKNLELLITAFDQVKKFVPSVLYIVGPTYQPMYKSAIKRQIATLGLNESVKIVGMVPRKQMNAYYNAADVLAVTSKAEEGGPTATLEALAVGLPVVSVPAGFARDIQPRSGGLLSIVEDASQYALSLQKELSLVKDERKPIQAWTWDDVLKIVGPAYSHLFE
ncbi:MAG: glycosyltransferase [Candidatus Kerfeldbacteria bacterium]